MRGLGADVERHNKLESQSNAIAGVFARQGYVAVSPPILQPADLFLDLMGETIRSKTYITASRGGVELCIRPDLTLAVCKLFFESKPNLKNEYRLSYDGPVFRLPRELGASPREWRHAGIECLNVKDREVGDAEVLATCLDALSTAGLPREAVRIDLNDLGLFTALASEIELPKQWRSRLVRHFLQPEKFKRLLVRLSDGAAHNSAQANLRATLSRLSESEARAVIADVMAVANMQPIGGRSIEEITERMLEQAADQSALDLTPETVALIERFLEVRGDPRSALSKLHALSKKAKLSLDEALSRFERRLALFEERGIALERIRFSTEFGRSIGYYTGLIFGLRHATRDLNLGSGGRYDNLLTALGSERPVPAVGGTLFCYDLLDARLRS